MYLPVGCEYWNSFAVVVAVVAAVAWPSAPGSPTSQVSDYEDAEALLCSRLAVAVVGVWPRRMCGPDSVQPVADSSSWHVTILLCTNCYHHLYSVLGLTVWTRGWLAG